jgi:hypothetical protein
MKNVLPNGLEKILGKKWPRRAFRSGVESPFGDAGFVGRGLLRLRSRDRVPNLDLVKKTVFARAAQLDFGFRRMSQA